MLRKHGWILPVSATIDADRFPTATPDETLELAIAYFVIVEVTEVRLQFAAEGIPSEE